MAPKVIRRSMAKGRFEATYFPGSRRIAPGIWVDSDGAVHFSVPELLELFDIEDTPENREAVLATCMKTMPPETEVVFVTDDALTNTPPEFPRRSPRK